MTCTCNAKRESVFDFDRPSNIQRRTITCLECGDVEMTIEAAGDFCYPRSVEDMLDMGLDPYIIEVFGGVGNLRAPMRSVGPTGRDAPRPHDTRPTVEDEQWRRERGEMLEQLAKGNYGQT